MDGMSWRVQSRRQQQSRRLPVSCTVHLVWVAIVLLFSTTVLSVFAKEMWTLEDDYNKNLPPNKNMEVSVSLFINRVSAVDENKEEIALDVFLQVYWNDSRVTPHNTTGEHIELTWDQRQFFWVPDLYIRQLRDMRLLQVFQEMASVRLYSNSTFRVSIGATVIIKCDMDFDLYPLDIQRCAVDFSSYKYTTADMIFRWRNDSPLSFPSDFGDSYRLPKYVVSFLAEKEEQIVFYGEGNHSTARLVITLSRELQSYLLETYLPSSLFVIMSWGSFVVNPDLVPGRMVLLVTTLLSLVTMFDTVRNNSPNALELKCIEVWLISCILFVFVALLEYFVVLFAMRYDKNWRRATPGIIVNNNVNNCRGRIGGARGSLSNPLITMQQPPAGPPNNAGFATDGSGSHAESPRRGSGTRLTLPSLNHIHAALATPEDDTAECSFDDVLNCANRKSVTGSSSADRLAVLRRVFPRTQTPPPPLATPEGQGDEVFEMQEDRPDLKETAVYTFRDSSPRRHSLLLPMSPQRWRFLCGQVDSGTAGARESVEEGPTGPGVESVGHGLQARAVAECCVAFCGSPRGTLDQGSLVLFPLVFCLFTIVYWASYTSEAIHRMEPHT